jgi:hypothetical protein
MSGHNSRSSGQPIAQSSVCSPISSVFGHMLTQQTSPERGRLHAVRSMLSAVATCLYIYGVMMI